MAKYMIQFQGENGHDVMTIEAENITEARNKFNNNIKIKKIQ